MTNKPNSTVLSVRLSNDELAAIDHAAKVNNKTRSEIIRQLIAQSFSVTQ